MIDEQPISVLWDIFYHFQINKKALSLLVSQSQKLFKFSEDSDAWLCSKYASLLKFCTHATLSKLRVFWKLYAEFETLPREWKRRLRKRFYTRADFTPDFQAAPLSYRGIEWIDSNVFKERFRHFWNTGTTLFDKKAIADATLLNPTFIYTSAGDQFTVNVGTDPLANFHLSSATLPIKGPSSSRGLTEGRQFLAEAQSQFTAYCAALRKAFTSPGRVVIRLFCGDALALCKALKQVACAQDRNPVCYSTHWSSSPLTLNSHDYSQNSVSSAPLRFNVIDVADLTDEVGLLNILLVATPLLSQTPSSTLYTDTLLSSTGPTSHFLHSLCGDVTVVTLLLNIIPASYFSNFSTWCNALEVIAVHQGLLTRFRDRIAWHLMALEEPSEHGSASTLLPVQFTIDDLVEFLFTLYLRMFGIETAGSLSQEASISETGDSRRHSQSAHYVVETFSQFLAAVKVRTQLVWMDAMKKFLKLVKAKGAFSLDFDHYEDLRSHLHRFDIVDLTVPDGTNTTPHTIRSGTKLFEGWPYVPSLVCIILVVPRSKLKILDGFEVKELGKAALHCEVRGSSGIAHGFASLRTTFGELSNRGASEHLDVLIRDDVLGLSGNEPLIVSFDVPYYILVGDPKELSVSLCARIVLPSSSGMEPQLGPTLKIFSASLSDSLHTCMAMNPPRISSMDDFASKPEPTAERMAQNSSLAAVSLNILPQQSIRLTLRANILGAKDKLALSSGAQVSTKRMSATAVEVLFGEFSKVLIFPVPIDESNLKTRIARKSAYIEVSLLFQMNAYPDHVQVAGSVADRTTLRGSITCLFPISLGKRTLHVTSMHRVNLDALPILDFDDSSRDVDWVTTHASIAFSDQERKLRENDSEDVLVNLKDNLLSLMAVFSGAQHVKTNVFGIHSSLGGVDTLLFVNQLRLDTSTNSIVVDVCILPMTEKLIFLPIIQNYLSKITKDKSMHVIHTADVTGDAWKQLLPVVVERCRSWSHRSNCEYSIKGRVPLTLSHSQIPICGCGQGLALGSFSKVKAWQGLEAFVTRAAIGLLFPSSSLETMITFPGVPT